MRNSGFNHPSIELTTNRSRNGQESVEILSPINTIDYRSTYGREESAHRRMVNSKLYMVKQIEDTPSIYGGKRNLLGNIEDIMSMNSQAAAEMKKSQRYAKVVKTRGIKMTLKVDAIKNMNQRI